NAKTSEGKTRFADFKGASQNSELGKLMNYNDDKREERQDRIGTLKKKLKDGGNLNYIEREILYQYIQEELLDERDDKHMDKIFSNMGSDNERVKKIINEDVLTSEASLNE